MRLKGLCALALLLLAAGLLADPTSGCALGGVPAPPATSGTDCSGRPAQAGPIAMRNPGSGMVGRSFILGPAASVPA